MWSIRAAVFLQKLLKPILIYFLRVLDELEIKVRVNWNPQKIISLSNCTSIAIKSYIRMICCLNTLSSSLVLNYLFPGSVAKIKKVLQLLGQIDLTSKSVWPTRPILFFLKLTAFFFKWGKFLIYPAHTLATPLRK